MNRFILAAKFTGSNVQQVGRKLLPSLNNAGDSYRGIGRVFESVAGIRPSSSVQQKHQITRSITAATINTTRSWLSLHHYTPNGYALSEMRRTKSSMAVDIEEAIIPDELTSNIKSTVNATYDQSVREPFPSIVIGTENSIQPQGSFAEAQAQFLDPDPDMVDTLRDGLLKTNMGIVAHYYMDVELQGVLQALKNSHPDLENRVGIADSLKMGDLAVDMCRENGVTSVICLGVDFMSESVAAILGKNGCGDVPVYRATAKHIGCSLAESAETETYRAWLHTESKRALDDGCVPLHVIYINTSLETKAISTSIVPTITCTSSNVVQTMLQAASEIPNLRILYGPDTYMGENLERLLEVIGATDDWTDSKIKTELHSAHTNASLQKLRDNLVVFPQGNCVVHHMFGNQVVDTVKEHYYDKPDTYVTAHLEVPGEMFDIAITKSLTDGGVVGSTSDILNFISRKVREAADSATDDVVGKRRLRFILGTEAGMVTSIVKSVQDILSTTSPSLSRGQQVEAEIIFPVSSEAVMTTDDCDSNSISTLNGKETELAIVPGVAGGEGCSTAGGCATCPFMKMNDLDAVQDIIDLVDDNNDRSKRQLQKHLPPTGLQGKFIDGIDAIEMGTEAILFMRKFMQSKSMPPELVQKVTTFSK